MIRRCYNPSHHKYHRYGGRGITVCEEWRNSFDAYYQHVTSLEGYGDPNKPSLDRIDNDGDYCPDNLRWASHETQNNNRGEFSGTGGEFLAYPPDGSAPVIADHQGRFAEEHDLTRSCITRCLSGDRNIHKGWRFSYVDNPVDQDSHQDNPTA